MMVVYNLPKKSVNFGWNVNGKTMGAIHLTKISGNSGTKSNGTERFWKFVSKIVATSGGCPKIPKNGPEILVKWIAPYFFFFANGNFRGKTGFLGRFPFGQKFRKFQCGAK